jgi:type I restriction enzyme S subunit
MSRSSLYPPSVDPGFPCLGPVPTGWTRTTFGSALEKVERPLDLEPDRKYRLVTAKRSRGGIVLRSELLGSEILTKTQFAARAGDFLISRRQIIHGACGVVPEDLDGAVVSNEYSTLRTRPGLLMDYLRHYCHTPYFQRTCFHSSHGVDVEKMIFKIDEWLAREVDLPPAEEQRKIAAILSSVDDAIEASQTVIDQLQVVKKAMMAELLTKGLPGRHKRFKKTEIGELPEEWEVVPLDAWIAPGRPICYGILMPGQGHPGGVPVIKVKNIKNGLIDSSDLLLTSPEIDSQYARSRLRPMDVLLTIRGTTGRVARVPAELANANITQDTARLSIRTEISTNYAFYCLQSELSQRQIQDHTRGQAVKGINIGDVRQLRLPLPGQKEQEEIAAFFEAMALCDEQNRLELEALRSAKSALMSVLLTGEVRVRVDEEAAA